ncbi:MAG: 6-carboxy-5,6,7,8-tetrahydropterin synthase [Elusimicrobia bacterium ADurb.Bin231]|nr:MAG: 6-carboxy-5,6,7,8-tetrahydropterin synthase [Elusimicrobia bacterium ADurb.Bin231]
MFEIFIDDDFSAAHSLKNYKGKCENLHGHNYKVRVFVAGESLDNSGMLMDFTELKRDVSSILLLLDHKCLDDVEPFDKTNPTAENIAKYIYDKLKMKIQTPGRSIEKVFVWETDKNCAVYYER